MNQTRETAADACRAHHSDTPSNDQLRIGFKMVHDQLVKCVSPSSIIDRLFRDDVLSEDHNHQLLKRHDDSVAQCRELMSTLHRSQHPTAFVQLRAALVEEKAYRWLIDLVDKNMALSTCPGAIVTSPVPSEVDSAGYKTRAQLLGKLKRPSDDDIVVGIAHDDGMFVVVSRKSNLLRIYEDRKPFDRREDLLVEGLGKAVDAASGDEPGRVYVAESLEDDGQKPGGYVWRVWPRTGQADRLVTVGCNPEALSVGYGRIVVTKTYVPKLFVFSADDGQLLNEIEIPSSMNPWHAVESPRGSFIVCLLHRYDQLCEVDGVDGCVLHVYGRQPGDDPNDRCGRMFHGSGRFACPVRAGHTHQAQQVDRAETHVLRRGLGNAGRFAWRRRYAGLRREVAAP